MIIWYRRKDNSVPGMNVAIHGLNVDLNIKEIHTNMHILKWHEGIWICDRTQTWFSERRPALMIEARMPPVLESEEEAYDHFKRIKQELYREGVFV